MHKLPHHTSFRPRKATKGLSFQDIFGGTAITFKGHHGVTLVKGIRT